MIIFIKEIMVVMIRICEEHNGAMIYCNMAEMFAKILFSCLKFLQKRLAYFRDSTVHTVCVLHGYGVRLQLLH